MVIPNHLLVHAATLRQRGLPVTRAHAPHSRHVARRISSAVPPAQSTFTSQGSPLPPTEHDEDANSSHLGRTGLCVERFLASLFRCSRASAKSESAKHFSLAVINRTNVLEFCLQVRPLQRGLLQWSFHLLPGFMLRQDSCDTFSNFALRLLCPTKPNCLHNSRILLAFDPSSFCCKHYPSTTNYNSNCVSLTTPHLECFTTLNDTCTNRSTRDLNVELLTVCRATLDTVMHDLAHDLVHPDRQDNHKIRYCLRQIFDARVGMSLLVFLQAPSLSASALSLAKTFSNVASEDAHSPAKV